MSQDQWGDPDPTPRPNPYGQQQPEPNPYQQPPNPYGPPPQSGPNQPFQSYGPDQQPYGSYPPGAPMLPTGPATLADPLYNAGFKDAFLRFWKKYATFTGRASRSEFWWWVLISYLVSVVLSIAGLIVHLAVHGFSVAGLSAIGSGLTALTVFGLIWRLATLVGTIALAVRRLHDSGRSGWWYLLMLPIYAYLVYNLISPPTIPSFAPGQSPSPTALARPLIALVPYLFAIPLLVFYLIPPKPEGRRFDRR